MSNASVRTHFVAALNAVPGITGYERRPTSIRPGDAWPMWRGAERSDGVAFVETWAVIIALPGDEVTADAFADAHVEDLEAALRPVMFTDSYAPSLLPTESGDMMALMITGRTE
jgi:hypothetical protein